MPMFRPSANRIQAIATLEIAAIGPEATITFYDAAPPADTDTAYSGTAMATGTLGASEFGTATDGVIALSGLPKDFTVTAAGTVAGARIVGADATYDLDVGTVGAAINLSGVEYGPGDIIRLNAGSVTFSIS